FFFSSRRRHTSSYGDWSSDVCSSDLDARLAAIARLADIETGLPDEQQRFHVFAALTRLRQIACHPRLADEGLRVRSSKLDAFLRSEERRVGKGGGRPRAG